MWDNFFQDIDIVGENVYMMDGNAEDLDQECVDYENKIKEAGGIHLWVAGGCRGGYNGETRMNCAVSVVTTTTTILN